MLIIFGIPSVLKKKNLTLGSYAKYHYFWQAAEAK